MVRQRLGHNKALCGVISLDVLSRAKRVPHVFVTGAAEDADARYILVGNQTKFHEPNLQFTTWMRHLALEVKKRPDADEDCDSA